MGTIGNLPLSDLEKVLFDPNSDCYLENLLDLVVSLACDCDFPSASSSRGVQSFLNRFKKVADVIQAHRTQYVDFQLIKVIGQGGFGRVELVRHKRTRRVYAIKMMSKQHLLDHSQSGYWEERDIMVRASSEWLVACHHAFLDKDNVYLCMEYMPGGDFYYWLEKMDTLSEDVVKFYLAETVLALEVLHGLRFIHRDLKPDNMLLDARGHLKLADFGSCVRLDKDGYHFCTSPIGTPDYISPEMLNCQSKAGKVGPECDWWAVGVIAFEMLFGEPAFYGQSLVETYSRILNHEKHLKFPTDCDPISPEMEQLIRAFLCPATTRLGSLSVAALTSESDKPLDGQKLMAATTNTVKSHPFFRGVEWSQLRSQESPIKPVVNSETDTSNINFDERDIEPNLLGSSSSSNLPRTNGAFALRKPPAPAYFTGNNLSFAGYTFNRDHIYLRTAARGQDHGSVGGMMIPNGTDPSLALTEATQRSRTLEKEVSEIRSKIHLLEEQTAMDQVKLVDSQRSLEHQTEELSKKRAEVSELEKSLNDLRTRNASVQTERDRFEAEVSKYKTEMSLLSENLDAERVKFLALDEEKTSLISQIQLLHMRINEAEVNSQTKQMVQSCTTEHTATTEELRKRVTNLDAQVASLQAENSEARQKSTLLMNEASNLKRNHQKQVAELNDQLMEAQQFHQLNQSQVKELTETAEASTMREQQLLDQLATTKAKLLNVESAKFIIETSLSKARIEMRSITQRARDQEKNAEEEQARFQSMKEQHMMELCDVSRQLDEMRHHCGLTEDENNKLTERASELQRAIDLQKRNMDILVNKLMTEVEGRMNPDAVRKRAREHDTRACQQLEKNYKNLLSTVEKNRIDVQRTIDEHKQASADSHGIIQRLTEESQAKDQDISNMSALIDELYARLEEQSQTHSTPLKKPQGTTPSGDGPESTTELLRPPRTSVIGNDAMLPSFTNESDELLLKTLEQLVDLDGKGRGRKKLIWLPTYAVIRQMMMAFYISRDDYDRGKPAQDEIKLCQIVHVRKATAADLLHADAKDICRTLQFFYDQDDTSTTLATPSDASEMDANTSVRSGPSSNQPIYWQRHTFQPMRFHLSTVLCEVCNRPLSDRHKSSSALQCVKCRIRIHLNHVEDHQKIPPCHNATRIRYIRLPTVQDLDQWVSHLNRLMVWLREMQNPEKLRNATLNSASVNQLSQMSTMYRSLRASSIGAGSVSLRAPTSVSSNAQTSSSSLGSHGSTSQRIHKRAPHSNLSSD